MDFCIHLLDNSLKELSRCIDKQLVCHNDIKPTVIYPTKDQVERENNKYLNGIFPFIFIWRILSLLTMLTKLLELVGENVTFLARDQEFIPNQLDNLDKNCPAKKEITLRVGAQVILLKNVDINRELVNGARGKIIRFTEADEESKERYPGK